MTWKELEEEFEHHRRYDIMLWLNEKIYQHVRSILKKDTWSDLKNTMAWERDRFAEQVEMNLHCPRRPLPYVDVLTGTAVSLAVWATAEALRCERERQFNQLKGTGVSNEPRTES